MKKYCYYITTKKYRYVNMVYINKKNFRYYRLLSLSRKLNTKEIKKYIYFIYSEKSLMFSNNFISFLHLITLNITYIIYHLLLLVNDNF